MTEFGELEQAVIDAAALMTWKQGSDGAALQAARSCARTVDKLLGSDDPQLWSKGAYLLPHLMNILRTLGGTPEARKALDIAVTKASEVDELKARRQRRPA